MEEDQQLLNVSQLHYMLLCSVDKAIKGRTMHLICWPTYKS